MVGYWSWGDACGNRLRLASRVLLGDGAGSLTGDTASPDARCATDSTTVILVVVVEERLGRAGLVIGWVISWEAESLPAGMQGQLGPGTCDLSQVSHRGCEGRRKGVRSRVTWSHGPSCISKQLGHKPSVQLDDSAARIMPTASVKFLALLPPLPP